MTKSIPKPPNTYPNNLKELEARDGYRPTEVPRYLGISQMCYNDLKQGKRKPSFDTLQKLERLYDITCQEIWIDWGNVDLHYVQKV